MLRAHQETLIRRKFWVYFLSVWPINKSGTNPTTGRDRGHSITKGDCPTFSGTYGRPIKCLGVLLRKWSHWVPIKCIYILYMYIANSLQTISSLGELLLGAIWKYLATRLAEYFHITPSNNLSSDEIVCNELAIYKYLQK